MTVNDNELIEYLNAIGIIKAWLRLLERGVVLTEAEEECTVAAIVRNLRIIINLNRKRGGEGNGEDKND
jgi:hypothetical protein